MRNYFEVKTNGNIKAESGELIAKYSKKAGKLTIVSEAIIEAAQGRKVFMATFLNTVEEVLARFGWINVAYKDPSKLFIVTWNVESIVDYCRGPFTVQVLADNAQDAIAIVKADYPNALNMTAANFKSIYHA